MLHHIDAMWQMFFYVPKEILKYDFGRSYKIKVWF